MLPIARNLNSYTYSGHIPKSVVGMMVKQEKNHDCGAKMATAFIPPANLTTCFSMNQWMVHEEP
jgi:hypothetical protein